jgi:heterodisulfide reductase subunit A
MAQLIKKRRPETEITLFYIDIQTFGKDFEPVYRKLRNDIRLIRAIPGDIFRNEEDSLRITFAETATQEPGEEVFDLVVLSIGLVPNPDTKEIARQLHLDAADTGFMIPSEPCSEMGIFPAGTVRGPMSIPESIASAGNAAWQVLTYLGIEF